MRRQRVPLNRSLSSTQNIPEQKKIWIEQTQRRSRFGERDRTGVRINSSKTTHMKRRQFIASAAAAASVAAVGTKFAAAQTSQVELEEATIASLQAAMSSGRA